MATTVNVTSTYVGSAAGGIIGKAWKEGDTLANNLVTLAPGVGFKLHLRKIDYTSGLQAYSCGHDPLGQIDLTEKTLIPEKFKNDLLVCKEDFRQTWSDPTMGDSAWNNMPADILSAIQTEVLDENTEHLDYTIWQGLTANATEFNGYLALFAADATVIKANNGIVPSGVAITTATVLAEFDLATSAIPYALRRRTLKFIVGPDVADYYSKALIEAGVSNGLGGNANTGLVYGRYDIEVVMGLPDNTIVIYEVANLVLGTGLTADFNRLEFVDEDSIGLLTGNVRGKMVYSAGVEYYNGEEIVWYLSTTTPV